MNMEKKFAVDLPVYRQTAAYAREHGELAQYRESFQANVACKESIEAAIRDNYRDNRLNGNAVVEALGASFSMERVQYVLANTVQQKDWDGRFSRENKEWAKSIPVTPNPDAWGQDRNCYFVVDQAHPGLVDLLVTRFRKEVKLDAPTKKPSVLEKLQKPLPEAAAKTGKDKTQEL